MLFSGIGINILEYHLKVVLNHTEGIAMTTTMKSRVRIIAMLVVIIGSVYYFGPGIAWDGIAYYKMKRDTRKVVRIMEFGLAIGLFDNPENIHQQLGQYCWRIIDFEGVAKHLERRLEYSIGEDWQDPKYTEQWFKKREDYLRLAGATYRSGQEEQGAQMYRRMLNVAVESRDIGVQYTLLRDVLGNMVTLPEIDPIVNKMLIDTATYQKPPYFDIIRYFIVQEQLTLAAETIQMAQRNDPERKPDYLYDLFEAVVLDMQGNHEEAAAIATVLSLDADIGKLSILAGFCAVTDAMLPQAIQWVEQAMAIDSEDKFRHRALYGDLLRKSGRIDEALDLLESLLQAAPNPDERILVEWHINECEEALKQV